MQVRESIPRYDAERNVARHFVPSQPAAGSYTGLGRAMRDIWGEPRSKSLDSIRRVLIVGDSPGVCAALAEAIRHPRLEVRTTDSPARAFASLARERTDFVIAESQLRLASGIDFLEVVRDEFPHASRVLLTGDRDVRLIREAVRRCGIGFFLPKPWDAGTIRELVERFLLAEPWSGASRDLSRGDETGGAAGRKSSNVQQDQSRGDAASPPAVSGQEE